MSLANFLPQCSGFRPLNGGWAGAIVLALLAPVGGQAAARPKLVWQGLVDRVTDLRIQGKMLVAAVQSGAQPTETLWRFVAPLPDFEARVKLEVLESRGYVHILHEPDTGNNYTLTIRIEDLQDGRGFYRLAVDWPSEGEDPTLERLQPEEPEMTMPGSLKQKPPKKRKAAVPRDAEWAGNGKRERVTGRLVWRGEVNGAATLQISAGGARVVSGEAHGALLWIGTPRALERARTPLLLPLTSGTSTVLIATPVKENHYTLEVKLQGGPGPSAFEAAW